ncbi:MAG: twitching motility protein PilT [Betaproteobacteria bacterium RIFCSPLOWO2_02_FULL_62_17]|nr:MAG: twitching motility protein PilT [Betaproteobacteria bacterium RIFCSPLOWO2_02_FULL_62_17]
MRLLLDTHIYLWYLAASRKLPKSVLDRIEIAEVVYISAASIWEAGIKIKQGRLQANSRDLVAGIASSGFKELPMTATHSALAASLPEHHRDPFDRMLIAQAMSEPLKLLTSDEILRRYSDLVEVI